MTTSPLDRDALRAKEDELAAARLRRDEVLRSINDEIQRLDREAKLLRGECVGNDKSDPVKNAGRKNVEALRRYMRRRKRTTQADAGRRLGINSGTLVWAFRALEAEGFLRDTGTRVGKSRLWEKVT